MPRVSRTTEVVDRLLDEIIDGHLVAGEPLTAEAELAEQFNVSRLTVREAVKLLQAQGVIVQVPGSRHRIAPVTQWTGLEAVVRHARSTGPERSSLDLLEVRAMIETGAAELAATRRTEGDLAQLRDALDAMRTAHSVGDVAKFVAADLRFHDVILAATGNMILVATLLPLTQVLRETREETSAVPEIGAHAIAEHASVLEAMVQGDPEATRAAMASHLAQTRNDLIHLVYGD